MTLQAVSRESRFASIARGALAVLFCVLITAVLLAIVLLANSGSKHGLVEALLLGILPILLYVAIKKPFIFPFGLYIILIPFDSLLQISSTLGTLTKLVGISCALAFVFWLVRNKRFVRPASAVGWWLALLVWMAMSFFWTLAAVDPSNALSKLTTYISLIGLYLVISVMPSTEEDVKAVLVTTVLAGFVASIYGIYLYKTGAFTQFQYSGGILTSRLMLDYGGKKWAPDELAAALLLPMALVMISALRRRWSLPKIGLIVVFLVLVGGMYVLGSRGALLALATMIGYFMVRSRYKGQLIALLALGFGASFLLPTSPWSRFRDAISSGGAGRLSIWKVGFESFKQHWLIGTGIGSFPYAYNSNFIKIYQTYYAGWYRAPHDILVEFSVELGIIGVLLLLAGWYAQSRSLSLIRHEPLFDVRIALEGAIIALFVASLFVGTMTGKYTWLLFSIMAMIRTCGLLRSEAMPQLRVPRLQPYEELKSKEPIHA